MKFTTTHLAYEYGFVSIVKTDDDDIACGMISPDGSDSCRWPAYLGSEPDWFDKEVSDLCNQVQDHFYDTDRAYRDYLAQVDADYLREKGTK